MHGSIPLGLAIVFGAAALWWRGRIKTARQRATLASWWGTAGAAPETDWHADEFTKLGRDAGGADGPPSEMDDRTWADLNMDDVLRLIDRTQTTLGRQFLHARLTGAPQASSSQRTERLAQLFTNNAAVREQAFATLNALDPATGQAYWAITRPGAIRWQWWFGVIPVLSIAGVMSLLLITVWPRALLVFVGVVVLSVIIRAATSKQQIVVRGAYRQVAPIIRTAGRLAAIHDVAVAGDGEMIGTDLRALAGLRRISSWVSPDPLVVSEIIAVLWEFMNLLFLLDANAIAIGAGALERHRRALARVSAWTGEIDVALGVASLRAEQRQWCIPSRTADGSPTTITGAWHPMLEHAVPNSVTLRPGEGIILTGSNMSGKSTFLRTIGVCVALADAINTCPCASYAGPELRVRSCIGRTDDLATGKSYYLAEVDAVMDILHASELPGQHLFLFDELFRGTNTIERLAAGEAVLRRLCNGANASARTSVIVATHDGELVSMLRDAYVPFHFQETISADGIIFDYQMHAGPATTRSALALLELHGAPPALLAGARARAAELDAIQRVRGG